MKTENSIQNLVGRAVAEYNRNEHNDATVRVEFINNHEFRVYTRVANGDNVPWAKRPHVYIWNQLNRFSYKCRFNEELHCCGNVCNIYYRY